MVKSALGSASGRDFQALRPGLGALKDRKLSFYEQEIRSMSDDERPDPDKLLARIQETEGSHSRAEL